MSAPVVAAKSGHTPGPWVNDRDYPGDIDGPTGQSIAFILDQADIGREVRLFARGADKAVSAEEANANARLIAAAPELLEALREAEAFVSGFEGDDLQDGIDARLSRIRAAIAAATGAEAPA